MNTEVMPELLVAFAKGEAYAVVLDDRYMSYHNNFEEAKKAQVELEMQGYVNVQIASINGIVEKLF